MDLVSTLEESANDESRAVSEPSKRERNKAEKRRRIVAAARQLFRDKGFEETTTAEISAAAGIATGTLYLYASSKEDLLVDVFLDDVTTAWSDGLEAIDSADALVDQLITVFSHVADHHLAEPVLSRPYFREMPFVSGAVRRSVRKFQAELEGRLALLMTTAQAKGELSSEVDCSVLANNLFAAWYLLMARHLGRDPDGTLHQQIERSVQTALLGLT